MKKFFIFLFFCPFLGLAQSNDEVTRQKDDQEQLSEEYMEVEIEIEPSVTNYKYQDAMDIEEEFNYELSQLPSIFGEDSTSSEKNSNLKDKKKK